MKYAIYSLFKGEENFVQSFPSLNAAKQAPKTSVHRWIAEMGIELSLRDTKLILKENGAPLLIACATAPKLTWKPYALQA